MSDREDPLSLRGNFLSSAASLASPHAEVHAHRPRDNSYTRTELRCTPGMVYVFTAYGQVSINNSE